MKIINTFLALLALLSTAVLSTPTRVLQPRATITHSVVTPSDVVVIFEEYPTWSIPSLSYGAVSKTNGAKARHTLFTFYFADANPSWAGHVCRLRFKNPILVGGSRRAQLFTLGSNVTAGVSWGNRKGAYRDQHVATFVAKRTGEGEATWEYGGTIKCPTTPYARLGFELVPAGDNMVLEWEIPSAGISVEVLKVA